MCCSQRKVKDVLKATYFLIRLLITFSNVMSTLPQEIECCVTLCVLLKGALFALSFETLSGWEMLSKFFKLAMLQPYSMTQLWTSVLRSCSYNSMAMRSSVTRLWSFSQQNLIYAKLNETPLDFSEFFGLWAFILCHIFYFFPDWLWSCWLLSDSSCNNWCGGDLRLSWSTKITVTFTSEPKAVSVWFWL